MTATSESDDWESLLDSGQLDANIKKLTILQRPQTSTITAPAPVSNQINVICEDDPRAQFKPTEPVIKIMKRPDIVKQNNAQVKPKAEQKSLKQREQEYAEARQRILGQSEGGEESVSNQTKSPARLTGAQGQGGPGGKQTNNGVARTPRGPPPDGSRGFSNRWPASNQFYMNLVLTYSLNAHENFKHKITWFIVTQVTYADG